jgi:Zn-dependent protease with chaperone function
VEGESSTRSTDFQPTAHTVANSVSSAISSRQEHGSGTNYFALREKRLKRQLSIGSFALGGTLFLGAQLPWATASIKDPTKPGFQDLSINAFQLGRHHSMNAVGPMIAIVALAMMALPLAKRFGLRIPGILKLLVTLGPLLVAIFALLQSGRLAHWKTATSLPTFIILSPSQLSVGFFFTVTSGILGAVVCGGLVVAPGDENSTDVATTGSPQRSALNRVGDRVAQPNKFEVQFKLPQTAKELQAGTLRQRLRACIPSIVCIGIALWYSTQGHYVLAFIIVAILQIQFLVLGWMSRLLLGPIDTDPAVQEKIARVVQRAALHFGNDLPEVLLQPSDMVAGVVKLRQHVTLRVTPGLVKALDDAALEAIITHEFAHLHHGDLVVALRRVYLSVLFPLGVGMVAVESLGHGSAAAYALLAVGLFPMVRFIMLCTSFSNRKSEYRADMSSARALESSVDLIRALEQMKAALKPVRPGIILRRLIFLLLLPAAFGPTTHPSFNNRILRLRSSNGLRNAE